MSGVGARSSGALVLSLLGLLIPSVAWAQDAGLDKANTAWILTATALVLFMTLPGLALFYAGLVRVEERAVGDDALRGHRLPGLGALAGRRLQPGLRRRDTPLIGDLSKVLLLTIEPRRRCPAPCPRASSSCSR